MVNGIPEVQAMWYGSQGFIGYQMCALMGQHWLINKACLIPARDAIRKGYDFTVNNGTAVAPEVLDAIQKANKRYRLNRTLVEYVKMGRVFGIRVALFKIESDDPDVEIVFGKDGRLLVTPGLSIFDPAVVSNVPVDTTSIEPITLQRLAPAAR